MFLDTLYPLGLDNLTEMVILNLGVNLDKVQPGEEYAMPYASKLSTLATWITSDCTPFLHLDGKTLGSMTTSDTRTEATSHAGKTTTRSTRASRSTLTRQTRTQETHTQKTHTQETHTQETRMEVGRTQNEQPSTSTTFARTMRQSAVESDTTSPSTDSPVTPTPTLMRTSAGSCVTNPESLLEETFTTVKASPKVLEAEMPEYSTQFCRTSGKYFTEERTHEANTKEFCSENKDTMFTKNSEAIDVLYEGQEEEIYQYSVSWAEDCTLLSKQGFDGCYDMMYDNYKICNNGGKGGARRKGCLLFEFRSNYLRDN